MKAFLITMLLGCCLASQAQQPVETPDSLFSGKIISDKSQHTRVYLTGFNQSVDKSGVYTTTFTFGYRSSRPQFDVNISMDFEQPLVAEGPVGFQYGPVGVGRYNGSGGLRNNNKYLFLQGQWMVSGHHFYIRVKSTGKIHPVIRGLDGQLVF